MVSSHRIDGASILMMRHVRVVVHAKASLPNDNVRPVLRALKQPCIDATFLWISDRLEALVKVLKHVLLAERLSMEYETLCPQIRRHSPLLLLASAAATQSSLSLQERSA